MSICISHNCTKCCNEREIILTHEDISRLLTFGHYEQTFARPSKYGHNLKELIFVKGSCIFFEHGKCSVYINRPTACRIYPYIMEDNGMTIDKNCPHYQEFMNHKEFEELAKDGINRIIKDIERTITYSINQKK